MFEHRKEPLAPPHIFLRRVLRGIAAGICLIFASLIMGIMGYHFIEGLPWIDSYLEAAMILSGMGPSASLHTDAGKIFAGTYAIYCGLLLIVTVGITFAPFIHRFFHHFHVELETQTHHTVITKPKK